MASPVLLGAVCASGRAKVALGFTEANQNLCGVVGKTFETSSLVPERDEVNSRGQRPRKLKFPVPTLKGVESRPKNHTALCDPFRVGQLSGFPGALPPATNCAFQGQDTLVFPTDSAVGRPQFCRLKCSISSSRSFTT
jgi:hypothetical protein